MQEYSSMSAYLHNYLLPWQNGEYSYHAPLSKLGKKIDLDKEDPSTKPFPHNKLMLNSARCDLAPIYFHRFKELFYKYEEDGIQKLTDYFIGPARMLRVFNIFLLLGAYLDETTENREKLRILESTTGSILPRMENKTPDLSFINGYIRPHDFILCDSEKLGFETAMVSIEDRLLEYANMGDQTIGVHADVAPMPRYNFLHMMYDIGTEKKELMDFFVFYDKTQIKYDTLSVRQITNYNDVTMEVESGRPNFSHINGAKILIDRWYDVSNALEVLPIIDRKRKNVMEEFSRLDEKGFELKFATIHLRELMRAGSSWKLSDEEKSDINGHKTSDMLKKKFGYKYTFENRDEAMKKVVKWLENPCD